MLLFYLECMDSFKRLIRHDQFALITSFIFLALTVWWVFIYFGGTRDADINNWFGFVYGGLSVWGGIWGLVASQKWGGFGSYIGRAIIFLAFGLLSQAFGQYSFWFINVFLKIAVPYPGIPDIGFFGTTIFYIYAAWLFAKSAGVKVTLKSLKSKLQALVIPLAMLTIGYTLFLRNYEFDFSQPLKIFLDFGYPLGQAIYISIAILTYSLCRKLLGGIMRFPILFIVFAFCAQFLADYCFIYFQEVFYPASIMDYLYLVAYFIMSLGVLQFKWIYKSLQD